MLEIGHYILLLVILYVVGVGFSKACDTAGYSTTQKNKFLRGYFVLMLIWVVYVFIIGTSGLIATFDLPPRLPLFIILPAFGIIIWFFTNNRFRAIQNSYPIALTVYFQSFRIFVELLILGLYYKGIGPELVTFEGRNFDILAGLSAPVIAFMAYNKKILSNKLVVIWNICSLLLLANIVSLFILLTFMPGILGYEVSPVSIDFTMPPYLYIAAVFMPVAVFLHVFSLRKTLSKKSLP